jgi:CRP/FNR family transcriptional regulator, nitrogen oxide reductase regulator
MAGKAGGRPMTAGHTPEITQRLANVALFHGLSQDAIARAIGLARSRAVGAGGYFFHEGDKAEAFFVLTSGRVKVTQLTPEGHQVVLRLVGPGDPFGGVGAFGDPTYPVSGEAIQPSVGLAWTSTVLRRLLETEPMMAVNALHIVAERLHDVERRYRQAMTERVERRVARALLRLVHDAGRRVDDGVEVAFPLSRQDIAEMTGTTLFTVSRLLSAWKEQGIVRSGRQWILLMKPHALVSIAEDLPQR